MKLQEIFDQLTHGELSQLNIGGADGGGIQESDYPRMVDYVNLGLTALFKRFTLKEGVLTLIPVPNVDRYVLQSGFVVGNRKSRETLRYLEENELDPFKDDLLKVMEIKLDTGKELPIDMRGNPYSVTCLSTTLIQVPMDIVNKVPGLPDELKTDKFKITYRANHPKIKIPLGLFDPARVEVQLPDAYLEALLLFIAARAHSPLGMQAEGQIGNNWQARYEAECQRLGMDNLALDRGAENYRLVRGGWV